MKCFTASQIYLQVLRHQGNMVIILPYNESVDK